MHASETFEKGVGWLARSGLDGRDGVGPMTCVEKKWFMSSCLYSSSLSGLRW